MRRSSSALLAAAALLLAACGGQPPDERTMRESETPRATLTATAGPDASDTPPPSSRPPGAVADAATPPRPWRVSVITGGLHVPWEVVFLPDGAALVSERPTGVVSHVVGGRRTPVRTIEGVDPTGEGGLLGLALSPAFAKDGLVYAYYTGARDNRVVRFRLRGSEPPQVVLSGVPKAGNHNGGRIAFGPDGKLYVGTGDAAVPQSAQDRGSLGGKILRLNSDGSVPADNPFPGSPVWSFGHRNVQGMAWDGRGRLWAAEFGPDRDDEINLIVRGGDYGWPDATGAERHDGSRAALVVKQPPEAAWSGLAFLSAANAPQWGDSLVAASLRGQRLWRFPVTADGRLGPGQALLVGEYGRLRVAVRAPDGSLWLSTSNRDGRGSPAAGDDRLLRYGP